MDAIHATTAAQKNLMAEDTTFVNNLDVEYLTLDANPRSDTWGSTDKIRMGGNVGDFMVGRLNKNAFRLAQVEVLVQYC